MTSETSECNVILKSKV